MNTPFLHVLVAVFYSTNRTGNINFEEKSKRKNY